MFDDIYSFWAIMAIIWALGAALMAYTIEEYNKICDANIPLNYRVSAAVLWPFTLCVAAAIALARFAQKLRKY